MIALTQPQPFPVSQPSQSKKKIAGLGVGAIIVIIIVLVILGGIGVPAIYYAAQQPNIQATAVNVPPSTTNPQFSTVVNEGTVADSGTFDYTASQVGTYELVFDNTFSTFSSKSVSVSYSATGYQSGSKPFNVNPGNTQGLTFNLNSGDRLSGSFSVSGGSGNDVDFYITAKTCTQTVNFSFTLVNSGSASGYATVQFTFDGQSYWSNQFFVSSGQQITETGSIVLSDCNSHNYEVVVSQVSKS